MSIVKLYPSFHLACTFSFPCFSCCSTFFHCCVLLFFSFFLTEEKCEVCGFSNCPTALLAAAAASSHRGVDECKSSAQALRTEALIQAVCPDLTPAPLDNSANEKRGGSCPTVLLLVSLAGALARSAHSKSNELIDLILSRFLAETQAPLQGVDKAEAALCLVFTRRLKCLFSVLLTLFLFVLVCLVAFVLKTIAFTLNFFIVLFVLSLPTIVIFFLSLLHKHSLPLSRPGLSLADRQ